MHPEAIASYFYSCSGLTLLASCRCFTACEGLAARSSIFLKKGRSDGTQTFTHPSLFSLQTVRWHLKRLTSVQTLQFPCSFHSNCKKSILVMRNSKALISAELRSAEIISLRLKHLDCFCNFWTVSLQNVRQFCLKMGFDRMRASQEVKYFVEYILDMRCFVIK